MTRKDYVAIARAFASVQPLKDEPHHLDQWAEDVAAVAVSLKSDNARFDVERFKTACGWYRA